MLATGPPCFYKPDTMSAVAPFTLIAPAPGAKCPLLFLCDHASNAVPAEYDGLGLARRLFETHIAYDIGAAFVTRTLAQAYGAPALLGGVSRLLIDLNRGADDPTLVMKLSDGSIIPGNRAAGAQQRRLLPQPGAEPQQRRHRSRARGVVCLAVNLVENRVHFQRIVALNILEAVGPRIR